MRNYTVRVEIAGPDVAQPVGMLTEASAFESSSGHKASQFLRGFFMCIMHTPGFSKN